MKMNSIMLVSIVGLASASFDYTGRPTIQHLVDFFTTEDKIYVFQRSYGFRLSGNDIKCICNMKISINKTNVKLQQSYKYHQGTKTYFVEATWSRGDFADNAPILHALAQAKYRRDYYFQYYDNNRKCAVFTFDHALGIPKCEIHIWNRTVGRGPSQNCEREYEYLCPRRKRYQVYESTCF